MDVSQVLLDALDRIGCGAMFLTEEGELTGINEAAVRLLCSTLQLSDEEIAGLPQTGRQVLKHLLRRAGERFRLNADNWIVVPRKEMRPIVLHTIVVLPRSGAGDIHTLLLMMDLEEGSRPKRLTLEQVFRLSPAEGRLALMVAGGATPAEAAQELAVSLSTVRSQLASIYAKTRTRRQSELVMLVARLAVLP